MCHAKTGICFMPKRLPVQDVHLQRDSQDWYYTVWSIALFVKRGNKYTHMNNTDKQDSVERHAINQLELGCSREGPDYAVKSLLFYSSGDSDEAFFLSGEDNEQQ